jgi:hypothetical protein
MHLLPGGGSGGDGHGGGVVNGGGTGGESVWSYFLGLGGAWRLEFGAEAIGGFDEGGEWAGAVRDRGG